MSSVCWILNSRKCVVFIALLTGANLVFIGLLTGANVWCMLDY